jgi:hypothetical protein
MPARLLGQRLCNRFKFLAIKNPAHEAGFFIVLMQLKYS